jgi:hypothetical protein
MAVEFLRISCQQRSQGQSATAKAAYNSCGRIADIRTGQTFDYSRKSGLVLAELIGAAGMDRQALWNRAELTENRKNSIISRSCEIALPVELDRGARIELAREISSWLAARYDVPVDLAVHEPDPDKRRPGASSAENPHLHAMWPDRDNRGRKLRQFSQYQSAEEIHAMRRELRGHYKCSLLQSGPERHLYTSKKVASGAKDK